jgi:hypothetical protein
VAISNTIFASTRHFSHFGFLDYGGLTVLGAVVATAAWSLVVRSSERPRRLFFRLALVVVPLLWLPDAWLLARAESSAGVGGLILMHVAVALVTYNALVRLAPPTVPGAAVHDETAVAPFGSLETAAEEPYPSVQRRPLSGHRSAWGVMTALTSLELGLGIVALFSIAPDRPSAYLPRHGRIVYFAHGALGLPLLLGALILVESSSKGARSHKVSAYIGLVGVLLAGLGGFLTVYHGLRLAGMAVMLIGALVAAMGYMMPALASGQEESGERVATVTSTTRSHRH